MSVLLLTMGPQLGLVMETPVLRVGEPGTIKFHAPGAVGPVKWSVVESDLPAEWGAITPDGADATINTAEALEWGEYTFTVRAVDSQRVPVARTFSVWVEPEDITVAAGGTHEWVVGTPVSLSLAITGGTGVYVSADVVSGSLPAGVTAQVSGSTLQISGTPSAIAGYDAVIAVSDSRGAQGITSVDWEVTSPPKILLGGLFTQINGVARDCIARLNDDGTLDTSFVASVTGGSTQVNRIIVLPTGKIMICGVFTHVNGVEKPYIARLHADGTLDTSFHCVPSADVSDMVMQSDGSIVIVGNFPHVNGSAGTQRYARIHEDGSTDTSFGPCTANNSVASACAISGSRTLVGGMFTSIGGVSTTARLAVLNSDGTVDSTFTPGVTTAIGPGANQFSVQPDGKILVAGAITSIFGTTMYRTVRLNANLTLDATFAPRLNNNQPYTAVPLANGKVLVGGSYSQLWNGATFVARRGIGEVDGTTGVVTSFNPAPSTNARIYVAIEMPDGDRLFAGTFTTVSGVSRSNIALVTAAGTLVSGFTPTANNTVNTGALQFL